MIDLERFSLLNFYRPNQYRGEGGNVDIAPLLLQQNMKVFRTELDSFPDRLNMDFEEMRIFIICHKKATCLKRSYKYLLKSNFPSGEPEEHQTGGDEQSSALWGENALKVRSEGVDVQKKSVQA